jgi:glutathione S-transferase
MFGDKEMALVLYELVGKNDRRYSGYCWRTRMAIAHKGLDVTYEPFWHGDAARIAFSGQARVPVLLDGTHVVADSWSIACYLDDAYPDRTRLMDGRHGRALTRLINIWADTQIDIPIVRSSFLDILHNLHPNVDTANFRATREARFGKTLEALQAGHPANVTELNRNLAPLRALLREQKWVNGSEPAYADYIVFGSLQSPRCLVGRRFLEDDDPIAEWFARATRLFNGLANSVSTFGEYP